MRGRRARRRCARRWCPPMRRAQARIGLTARRSHSAPVRNRTGLTDYSGELQARLPIRITDLDNPPPSGGSGAATAQDGTFAYTVPCAPTGDTSIGSQCTVTTTADAVTAGVI